MTRSVEKALTLEDILRADDIEVKRVDVPEWGGHVYVKTMSGTDRERYIKSIQKVVGEGKDRKIEVILEESGAKLLVRTVCDEKGNLVFSPEHVELLTKKSGLAAKRVTDVAAEINGLTDDAVDVAKNVSAAQTATDSDLNTVSPVI